VSDHFSGPAVMGDPSVDITDFYAFPSPERPGNLVLIMDVFPLATPQSFFSDVLTYRFRLRPLTRSRGNIMHGAAEHTIEVSFNNVPEGTSAQKGNVVTSDGRKASFVVGEALEQGGMRVFAGPAIHSSWMSRPRSGRMLLANSHSRRKAPAPFSFATFCRSSSRPRLLQSAIASIALHRGEPCHAPGQANPDRTCRAPGD
jgi:hypothetical protein